MARVIRCLEHMTTRYISRQDNFRQTMRSGHSLWATRAITLYRIPLTDIASAIALASCQMPMAPLISIFNTLLPQVMSQTGYPHRLVISYSGCACICPVKPFSTASIRCRQWSKYRDRTYESAYIWFGCDRGVGSRHVSPRLLLAAPCEQYLQEGSPQPRIRRGPRSDQYALYGTPSAFCGSPPPARLGLKTGDDWREPRHTPGGRLARVEQPAASPPRARLLRPLLQRAVHRPVQHRLRVCRHPRDRHTGGRLSH